MKKLLLLIAFATLSCAYGQTAYKCYNLQDTKIAKIQLKFYGNTAASVKYKGQKEAIPLVLVPGSRKDDSVFYNEKYNGKLTGSYEIQYREDGEFLIYNRKKDGAVYTYILNEEMSFGQYGDGLRTKPCF